MPHHITLKGTSLEFPGLCPYALSSSYDRDSR